MHSLVSHAQRSSVMQTVMILISCSVSLRIESRTWCHPRDIGWSLAVISDCISTISTSGSCHLNHHHCHPPGYLDHHQPGSPCLHHTPPDNIWMQLGVELKKHRFGQKTSFKSSPRRLARVHAEDSLCWNQCNKYLDCEEFLISHTQQLSEHIVTQSLLCVIITPNPTLARSHTLIIFWWFSSLIT